MNHVHNLFQSKRSVRMGMTAFFVLVGICFTFPEPVSTVPPAVFAQSALGMCAPSSIAWCDTPIAYFVFSDLTLPSDTEITLAKSIVVVNDAHLTIEPGATLIFSKGDGTYTEPLGLVAGQGRITANGSAEEPIIFTKDSPDTVYSIYFYGASVSFSHVRIDRGGEGEPEQVYLTWLDKLTRSVFADTTWANMLPAIWYQDGVVTIRDSVISGSQGVDIFLPGSDDRHKGEGIPVDPISGSTLLVERTDFGCDADVPAFIGGEECDTPGETDCGPRVTLRDNWYGSESGPRIQGQLNSVTGKEIIGPMIYDGFAQESYMERCASNVLFLPGIKASRLYMNTDHGTVDKLWPPTLFSDDISDLALDKDGDSVNPVYTEDVIESVPFSDFYASFIADLKRKKEEFIISDFLPFAYDWRMSVRDVAYGLTPYPGDHKSLLDEATRLAQTSRSGKVTIVAHSNGGLVAKELLMRLEEEAEATEMIDRVIFVGTPQIGTPKSVLSLLYGYEEELVGGFLASRKNVRELAENMLGAYGLLPSKEYFDRTEEPIVTFSPGSGNSRVKSYYEAYRDSIDDRDELEEFLSGEGDEREKPEKERTDLENTLSRDLLNLARSDQDARDGWTPPADIEVIQIAGWGLDTISGIRYAEREKMSCSFPILCSGTGEYETFYEPKFTVDGDAIVTAPSALMLSEEENVKKYWINLYDNDSIFGTQRKHEDILELSELRTLLTDILQKEEVPVLPEYISTARPSDYEGMKPRIRMSLYSPLDVTLTDGNKNRTGTIRITENGEEHIIYEQHIPGSSFFDFDGRKYASFPARERIDIRLDGYADGAYTLKFEEVKLTEEGEEVVSHTTFEHLPTTADTTVELIVPEEGLSGLSPLVADIDGDGDSDYTVKPVLNGIATLETDTTPPETSIEIVGSEGENGWFLGDVSISLTADDDRGEVVHTEYSFDDGATWETYQEPFTISGEGITSILYRSTDDTGNVEETKRIEVKIDRTPPTARIGFDPETRMIVVSGSDEQSAVDIEREEEYISSKRKSWRSIFSWIPDRIRNDKARIRVKTILTDEAGHTTEVTYTETRRYGVSFELSDFSASRNGTELDTSHIRASYHMFPGRWGRDFAFLSAFLRTDREIALSRYFGRRDKTWIVSLLDGRMMLREWKSGIVVPMLEAGDNGVKIIWE